MNSKKRKGNLLEIWHYRDLIKQLVVRDLKKKYRRSFLGYVWSILNPLLIMIVLTVVFSTMFKRNIDNFPVYLFCGQLLYNFMSNSTHQAIFSITGNASLLKKTYLPKYIFTVAKITSGFIDFVLSLGALLIVMIATKATFSWWILLFPVVIVQLYIFNIGLGLFLSQAHVFFRDMQYIYNAVTTAWMYATPILYPIDLLPDWLKWIVTHLNPMYFYVEQFRDLFYYCRPIRWKLLLAGSITALLVLFIGIKSFRKSEDKFILYI